VKSALALRHLVNRLGALSVDGALDAPVAALAYDERRVVPGAVFFAMPDRADGEAQFAIPRAIERGAAAIVCEQGGFLPYRAARIRVANCRRAMAAAAAAFHGEPSHKLQVVVVTGCDARAAVAHLLRDVFAAAGIRTGVLSSRGCRYGERSLPPLTPAPEALDVQERLADMLRAGCQAGILELPAEAIDRGCLAGSELDTLISTQISPAHAAIGNGTPPATDGWENNLRFRGAAAGQRPASRIWRIEDVLAGRAGSDAGLWFRAHLGPVLAGTFRARLGRFTPRGTRLEITTPTGEQSVRLPLPGRNQARAALAVAAISHGLRLPPAAVLNGLGHAPPVPGQLEPVSNGHAVHVLVDAAPSLADFERALREVRDLSPGRVLVLFGCGWRHPAPARPAFGAAAARWADEVILTSDNPGREPAGQIAAEVAAGHARVKGRPPLIVLDRQEAIAAALAHARAGDCVLLAGKGHLAWQETDDCVAPFDDREQARAALRKIPARSRPAFPEVLV
jgi:UDP-N-acetylmuramoyl-L-alanyl-D-glutamate--2,6-diaminopimelate ligase